ncbi:hypothetical protein [Phreatobacter sp.]|uniref:hypothetical protein n=1 Tax=Phreatobacter sp. TaxID=1966341 RepID=UPI003F715334
MPSRDTRPDDKRSDETGTIEREIIDAMRTDPRAEDGRIIEENGTLVEPDRRQMPPPAEAEPGPQIVNADTVRSAPLGRPVLMVLTVSLAAAALVLFVLLWGFAS